VKSLIEANANISFARSNKNAIAHGSRVRDEGCAGRFRAAAVGRCR
jgi:hypothetical protein